MVSIKYGHMPIGQSINVCMHGDVFSCYTGVAGIRTSLTGDIRLCPVRVCMSEIVDLFLSSEYPCTKPTSD